jgi:hypothetical protein
VTRRDMTGVGVLTARLAVSGLLQMLGDNLGPVVLFGSVAAFQTEMPVPRRETRSARFTLGRSSCRVPASFGSPRVRR